MPGGYGSEPPSFSRHCVPAGQPKRRCRLETLGPLQSQYHPGYLRPRLARLAERGSGGLRTGDGSGKLKMLDKIPAKHLNTLHRTRNFYESSLYSTKNSDSHESVPRHLSLFSYLSRPKKTPFADILTTDLMAILAVSSTKNSDSHESVPRHLSLFSYLSRPKKTPFADILTI